ncbi:MAG: RsiV family protein [Bacteroidales bacterium]|nr:RsiV family protein [Bacteroidales bacterium]
MIRKTIPLLMGCMLMLALVVGCGKSEGTAAENDSVTFVAKKVTDTTSFKRSNGELCKVLVEADVAIPDKYAGKAVDAKFVKLFSTTVLSGADSLSIDEAVAQLVQDKLCANKAEDIDDTEEDDALATSNVSIKIKVYPVYNHQGVLTMCVEENVAKDGVPSVAHRYHNFSMENMAVVDLEQFEENAFADMALLLQNKLMEQNKVKTPEELSSLGFFDIYNLTVTSNFYFTADGIVWSYRPQELTVDANTEPTILVPFADLVPFVKEGSVVEKFM